VVKGIWCMWWSLWFNEAGSPPKIDWLLLQGECTKRWNAALKYSLQMARSFWISCAKPPSTVYHTWAQWTNSISSRWASS
jgi:hypothetical protein